jgi:hypothetical protein
MYILLFEIFVLISCRSTLLTYLLIYQRPEFWPMKHVWFQSNKQLFFTPHFLHCLPLICLLLPHWKRGLHCFQVKELGWSCKSCCSQTSDYSPNEWFTLPSHQPLLLSDWFRWHSCGPSGGHEFRFITCRRLQTRASQYVTGNLLLISLLLFSACS